MRNVIYLILFALHGYSASLTLNETKEHNKSFSILHIKDEMPFSCEIKMGDDFKDIVVCTFSQRITSPISKSNRDFSINSIDNQIQIVPNAKIKLLWIQEDFITTNIIKSQIEQKKKHWMVVGYKDKMPLLQNSNKDGINFDTVFQKSELPYVGSLDLNGLPIVHKSDAVDMSYIRKAFDEGNYDRVITLSDRLLDEKKESFSPEAKLYKIRAMDKLVWETGEESQIDKDELLELSQDWIGENSSSKYLPEVLMYISKTYYKLGHIGKGDEYSNILKDEFNDNKFSKIAQLHKADRIYKNRKRRAEALKIYKEVLYNTDNLDIASRATSKISERYLQTDDANLAEEFYRKIVDANEPYIRTHMKESYDLAKKFAEVKKYKLAIDIVGILLSHNNKNKHQDEMRKNIAYWYELSGNKDAAFGLYKQYLQDYKNGEYVGFVKSRLDKTIFDIEEKNITKKMANIENILLKYPNDPIYKKALIEKAKILIENRKYKELFSLEKELKKNGGEKFLGFAAEKKISEDLQNDNCKDAMYIADEYNVTVTAKYEKKYFSCLMRYARYKKALQIAKKHLNNKDLHKRLEWMYQTLKVYSKLDKNKSIIMLGEDIEKLSKILKTNRYDDIVYEKALAYYNLKNYDDMMLREVKKAETLFPTDIRNIDLFVKILRYAKDKKDDLLIVNYAKRIMELQKRHKISDYSPLVELDYVNALKRLKQYAKALKEDIKLLYLKLNDVQRANVLYIAGELSLKTNKPKEAKGFFIKCGEIVDDSSWQRLCAENLKLLEE
jgi:tetratricopeptide (TPR) repeat protein